MLLPPGTRPREDASVGAVELLLGEILDLDLAGLLAV
jgi:hypothetical protein